MLSYFAKFNKINVFDDVTRRQILSIELSQKFLIFVKVKIVYIINTQAILSNFIDLISFDVKKRL